jgi:hypothetical protein
VSAWVIFQLFAMATMPAAFHMARNRGRSTYAWLNAAMIFGPFALLALIAVGKRATSRAG